MNLKIKVIALILTATLISCKQKETKTKKINQVTENTKISNQLIFEIDLDMSVPDDVKLMANDVFLNNGQFMDLYITQKLNSNETSKKILFELPESIKPDAILGISFGAKKVKEVTIKQIKIKFGNLSYDINPSNFNKYFRLNKYISSSEEQGVFITKKIDGKHNPIIFLRKTFIDKF